MSDLVGRPDNPESQIDPVSPEDDVEILHSGDQKVDVLSTPLHEAPVHPIPDTVQEFVALKPGVKEESEAEPLPQQTGNRWLKPVGGAIAALGLAAGAFFIGSGSDESKTPAVDTVDLPVASPVPTQATSPEITTPINPSPETIAEYNPVLITGTTPREVLDKFYQNYDCVYNATDGTQYQCLDYILGDLTGPLETLFRDRIQASAEHRESTNNPEFKVPVGGEILDKKTDDREMIIVTEEVRTNGSISIIRYTFAKNTAHVQTPTVEDELVDVWTLAKEAKLEPGQAYFDA